MESLTERYLRVQGQNIFTKPQKPGYIRAKMVLDCQRLLAFQYFGITRERSWPVERTLLAKEGWLHEQQVMDTLQASGLEMRSIQRFTETYPLPNLPVKGKIEAELPAYAAILEIKTLAHARELPNLNPNKHHRAQVEVYLRSTPYKQAVFFYKARDYGAIKEFWVERDDNLWDEIVDHLSPVALAQSPLQVPKKLTDSCVNCPFKQDCWK